MTYNKTPKAGNADIGLQLQDSENRIAEDQKFKAILSYIVNLRQKKRERERNKNWKRMTENKAKQFSP